MRRTRTRLAVAAAAVSTLLTRTSHAAGFTSADTVFDSQQNIAGSSDAFLGTDQIVVGNGGVVATFSEFESGQFITYTPLGGGTQFVARTDSTGSDGYMFGRFSELSLTQGSGDKLTFLANDQEDNYGLFQASVASGTMTTTAVEYDPDHYTLQTDTTLGADITQVHYTVNALGQAAYQRLSTDDNVQQIVRSGADGFVISDDGSLTNFNTTSTDRSYKRVQVSADGSAVFRATSTDGFTGIYRETGGSATPIVSTSSFGLVVSASDDRVLYSDIGSNNTATLNLTGLNRPLATYTATDRGPRTAVMTQQNRVAFFDPDGGGTQIASLGYYAGSGTAVSTVATEHETFSFNSKGYTIERLSSVASQTSNPMLNDHGIVVFDATLTPDGGGTGSVTALIAWWAMSPNALQIVVKASDDSAYADKYTDAAGVEHQITALLIDGGTDQAGDVTKDALSDDDYLAYGIDYDQDAGYAVLEQQLVAPEPASVSVFAVGGSAALLKRRRRGR